MSAEQLVPVRDVELATERFGDPAHPPVLLLAGAAASRDLWPPDLCRALAADRYVVRYDHRDTGASTAWPRGGADYRADDLTRDAAELVASFGRPVHLVGMSMGGGIAQALALGHPREVTSLTLVATSPAGGVDADLPGPVERVQRIFADPPPEPDWADEVAVTSWWLETQRAFAGAVGIDEDDERAAIADAFARTPDLATAQHHWTVEHGDDEHDVHGITAPTLVVHGTDDPLFPLPHGEALAAAVPGARLLTIEGMGHQVPPRSVWPTFVRAVLAHTA